MQTTTKKILTPAKKGESLKICILGTRGIPNQYGGFEQFAEKFASRMADRGHQVYVYSSHNHSYKHHKYGNVHLIRCFDPEYKIGTAGQFIYDLNCILDSRKRGFDVIFQLGYTSSTIWSWLLPGNALVVTNMDGLEWQRTKYNKLTRWFLTYAEKWGAKYSDHLIADSKGIKDYLWKKYQVPSTFIPYGADIYEPTAGKCSAPGQFNLAPHKYDLLIARFEPENNIETALKAYAGSNAQLALVGNYKTTSFGTACYNRYKTCSNIRFLGPIYDDDTLNELRYFSRLYIHGHSVGGTNPSLLEAMACRALILAHDNVFNRSVLRNEAFFFSNESDLERLIKTINYKEEYEEWINNNIQRIREKYNWDLITDKLENTFRQWVKVGK